MIQLVCVNAGKLVSKDSSIAYGSNLVKGKIYTSTHKTISHFGDECYHVVETGDVKQCVRFKEITKRQKKEINKANCNILLKKEVLKANFGLIFCVINFLILK